MPSLISHSVVVLFGVFLILFSIVLTNNIRDDYRSFVSEEGVDHLCMLLKGAVAKIYVSNSTIGRYNDTMGSITVFMPPKIAGSSYRASFFNKSVRIEVFSEERRNATCLVGFDAAYSGSAAAGPVSITLFHHINGTRSIEMRNV